MALGLEGIKVVQTATVLAGPMAARLLADWGADVIRIEPIGGETSRAMRAMTQEATKTMPNINYSEENLNRNKRAIALDLSRESGLEILYGLLAKSDVFLSNFRPRELEKFKLEYETLVKLNSRLVHANITGYGKKGPDRDLPAYGILAHIARTGIQHMMEVPGIPPVVAPVAIPDMITGLALAYGVMLALFIRERTGMGQEVNTSLFSSGLFTISPSVAQALNGGQDRAQATRYYYPTKDGRWVCLSRFVMNVDRNWSRFCRAIERDDLEHDPRFASVESRMVKNRDAMDAVFEQTFPSRTLEEWKVRLNDAAIPWAPMQTLKEVVNDPQARANDFFIRYDHPSYGRMELLANPVSLSRTPETIRMPAPRLGEHTDEVLLEYGYTADDIARFREQQVIA